MFQVVVTGPTRKETSWLVEMKLEQSELDLRKEHSEKPVIVL